MKTSILYSTISFLALPIVAFAQSQNYEPNLGWFNAALTSIGELINAAIPILIALGLLLFIWGLVVFIFSQGDDDAQKRGKKLMVWGVIALFVIVSVWGLVALLGEIVGVNQGGGYTPIQSGI